MNNEVDESFEDFEEIINSYVNGQNKQMVKQMDQVLIYEFLKYYQDLYSANELVKLMIIYFKLKESKNAK